jgi:hypothetical protein
VGKVPSENPLSNEIRVVYKHEGIQTEEKEPLSRQNYLNSRSKSLAVVPKLQIP